MLRLIFLVILIIVLYQLFKGLFGQKNRVRKSEPAGIIDDMVQDPYCKKYIPRHEAIKRHLGGKELLFCSKECADKFETRIEGKQ
jgi:YHS domain-containing protein